MIAKIKYSTNGQLEENLKEPPRKEKINEEMENGREKTGKLGNQSIRSIIHPPGGKVIMLNSFHWCLPSWKRQ